MFSCIGPRLVFLLVVYMVVVSLSSSAGAAASHVCREDFKCGKFGYLSFPFTDSAHPDCGLFIANCSDPTISLYHRTYRSYKLINIFHNNSIRVLDTKRQDNINQRTCMSFHVINQGSLEAVSFTVEPNITMIKCTNDTVDKSGMVPLKSLSKYTACGDEFTIYYTNPKGNHNKPPLYDIAPLPTNCQPITLPMASEDSITKETGLFGLLTAEFDLRWQLSANCSDCLDGKNKGSQCYGDNEFCANAGITLVSKGKSKSTLTIIIVVCIIVSLLILTLCLCVLITRRRRRRRRKRL